MPTVDPLLSTVVAMAFAFLHGFAPQAFQEEAAAHLLQAHAVGANGPTSILLCAPTGGGKSAVRDCFSHVIGGGVSLTIVPLLALAGDQTRKIQQIAEGKPISVYNIDEMKGSKKTRRLQRALIDSLHPDNGHTVYIFSSPQTITRDSSWKKTILKLIDKQLLSSVTIDECHLFANFGVEFRSEFLELEESLFNPLQKADYNVPVLFMTGSGTAKMVTELEQLTGIQFDKDKDILWSSSCSDFARRNVTLNLKFDNSPLREIKTNLRLLDKDTHRNHKIIIYTNSVRRCVSLHDSAASLMNSELIFGDLLSVNGTLFREQKSHDTELFSGPDLNGCYIETNGMQTPITFSPRVLVATSGAANAGLDSPQVRTIIRDGFPPTIQDLVQELGRAARYPLASAEDNQYQMVVSLMGFYTLLFRIFVVPILAREQDDASKKATSAVAKLAAKEAKARAKQAILSMDSGEVEDDNDPLALEETEWMNDQPDDETNDSDNEVEPLNPTSALMQSSALAKRQYTHLQEVLSVLTLNTEQCIHSKLECKLVNPYWTTPPTVAPPCGNACWVCLNNLQPAVAALKLHISIAGLKYCLIDIFFNRQTPVADRLLKNSILVETLSSYKDSHGKTFQNLVFKRSSPSTSKTECRALVLKLFATGILEPQLDGKLLYCDLAIGPDMIPIFHKVEAYNGVATQEYE
jgi:hypothetical protein